MNYDARELFAKIKEIGKEEAGILCNTEDDMSGYLEDTALFLSSQSSKNSFSSVTKAIIGIDLEPHYFYLNDFSNTDLIITHHPIGKAQYNYYKIFSLYKYIFKSLDLEKNDKLIELGIQRLRSYSNSINSFMCDYLWKHKNRSVMCIHSIADICANNYLNEIVVKFFNSSLKQMIECLSDIPAIKVYKYDNLFPYIALGRENDVCGKIFIDMLNGVVEVPEYLEFLSVAGINTIITMHITEEYLKQAKKSNINLINIGHVTADNLGMNLILNKILKGTKIEVVFCGGFRRVSKLALT